LSVLEDHSILYVLLSAFYMSKEPVPQNHDSVCHTTATLSSKVAPACTMFLCVERSLNTLSCSVHLLYIKNTHPTPDVSGVQITQFLRPCFSAWKDQLILHVLLSAFYISKQVLVHSMFLEYKSHNSCTMVLCVKRSLNILLSLFTLYIYQKHNFSNAMFCLALRDQNFALQMDPKL
jgi:hypothetical protein